MHYRGRILLSTSLLACVGCAAVSAPQIGQAVGAIAGTAIAPGVGTQLGSLAGIVAGMVAQGEIDKATEKKERKLLSKEMSRPLPEGTSPQTLASAGTPTRVWVDETIQNGQVTSGHFETRAIQ